MQKETWSTRHELEGLSRYLITHAWHDFEWHPVDRAWWEEEQRQLKILINYDPIRPTEEEYRAIERKHTYWRGCTL